MQSVKSAERSSAATRLQKKLWIWDSNYSVEHFLHQLSLTYYSSKFQFICFYFHNSFQAACHTSGMCLYGFVCACVHMCACVRECMCVCCPLFDIIAFIQAQTAATVIRANVQWIVSDLFWSVDTSRCRTSGRGHQAQLCFHSISDQQPNSHFLKSFIMPQQ